MNKVVAVSILSVLGGSTPSVAFQSPISPTISRHGNSLSPTQTQPLQRKTMTMTTTSSSSSLRLSPDPYFVAGSFLWTLNFYYGFDWILAPLGFGWDSDFNPAYRTATFVGSVLAGESFGEALEASGSIVGEDGERPEMGSRIGSGANAGYVNTEVEKRGLGADNAGDNAGDKSGDWLSDRRAGLRSSAPLPLRLLVALFYGVLGLLAMAAFDSVQTAAVLTIPALVYEIGRPSLPTREEAVFDAELDRAVTAFARENLLLYGQDVTTTTTTTTTKEGAVAARPVGLDEATNERELVGAFRKKWLQRAGSPLENGDVSDFQIEMRFREMGTGRSEGGFIRGIRLLREPVSSSSSSSWQ